MLFYLDIDSVPTLIHRFLFTNDIWELRDVNDILRFDQAQLAP
jgi:hypothetical protein